MEKPALEEVSDESRAGWLGDLSPKKQSQSQGLKEGRVERRRGRGTTVGD